MKRRGIETKARASCVRGSLAFVSPLLAVAAALLVGAGSAEAATYTLGSPLTASFSPGGFGTDTIANPALPEPGANVTSPVTGTVVRWRILDATGGPFNLRVLTPNGGITYTGDGTSAPRSPTSTALQTFSTNMPIRAGQAVGLDNINGNQLGFVSLPPGAISVVWNPPLTDGSMRAADAQGTNEFAFNADVVGRPGVNLLSPASGPASGGTTVAIVGHDLSGATAVNFGSRPASVTSTSDSVITVVSPPGTVGVVDVTVTTPGGQSPTTAADRFTYTGCVVPNLKGKKLKRAKKVLGAAECKLGKAKGRKTGKVKKQKPKAGTVLAAGSKVRLKLG